MPKAFSYVRFSSLQQAQGDSKRRQVEAAEKYAQENGLELDLSLKPDEGLSAFSGANLDKGHLGQFLELVEEGKVSRGSVLIVESLDRISRQKVTEALTLFMSIIQKGIKIVTLTDGKSYDGDSIADNPHELIWSILVMIRANEESEIKSKRGIENWRQKRKKIRDKPLTSICPAWLRINNEGTAFELIPERAELVRRIFELSKDGVGQVSIARKLNREGIDPWGRGKRKGQAWQESYIAKILRNREVIGEFRPHTQGRDRIRRPTDEIVEDYFPQAISKNLFYEVQELRKSRRLPQKGQKNQSSPSIRKGQQNNLFTNLATCGYCGERMRFVSKGNNPKKGGKYLVCKNAHIGKGCKYITVNYPVFEENVLLSIREPEFFDSLFPSEPDNSKERIESELAARTGELESLRKGIERMTAAIKEGGAAKPKILTQEIVSDESRMEELQKEIQDLNSKLSAWAPIEQQETVVHTLFNELSQNLSDLHGEDLLMFRSRVHKTLSRHIDTITVYPRNKKVHEAQMALLPLSGSGELSMLELLLYPAKKKWPKEARDRPMIYSIKVASGHEWFVIAQSGVTCFINSNPSEFRNLFGRIPNMDETEEPRKRQAVNTADVEP